MVRASSTVRGGGCSAWTPLLCILLCLQLILLFLLFPTAQASDPVQVHITAGNHDSTTIATALPEDANTTDSAPAAAAAEDPYASWVHGLIPPGQAYWQPGKPRPAGSLLLNMLIKNEAEHLNRTLPAWARIVDYWVVGVDDGNTDDSEAVILRHLSHLPGRIERVHFTGMGPTWTLLVEAGLRHFPQATHGIIADADFRPLSTQLDRMELDVRCSKHMYTILTADHATSRRMDWVYRNIRGVKVERRTHQILTAPALPEQEVFQTLLTLQVDEREGGYQDRSGEKDARYIGWLQQDLEEHPDDPRTLYYLAYAHLNLFLKNTAAPPDAQEWVELQRAVVYFKRRAEAAGGNKEERWFAMLKLAEVYERFYRQWTEALFWYEQAVQLDGERADAFFYVGQHYRLHGEYQQAVRWLRQATALERPVRALFQWEWLYACLRGVELAEAVSRWEAADAELLSATLAVMKRTNCDGDRERTSTARALTEAMQLRLAKVRAAETAAAAAATGSGGQQGDKKQGVVAVRKLLSLLSKHDSLLREELDGRDSRLMAALDEQREAMRRFVSEWKAVAEEERLGWLSCRRYRQATAQYVRWWKQEESSLAERLSPDNDALLDRWRTLSIQLRATCR
jgi:hypothetical protein